MQPTGPGEETLGPAGSRRDSRRLLEWASMVGGALAAGIASGASNPPWLPLLGVAVVAALLAMLANLEIGLAALSVIVYSNMSDVAVARYGAPSVTKLFLLVLAAAAAYRWWFRGERPRLPTAALMLLVGFAVVKAVSIFHAADPARALEGTVGFAKDAVVAAAMATLLLRVRGLRLVVWALLGTGLALSTISVYQGLTGAYGSDFGGFGQAAMHHVFGQTDEFRAMGPLDDPNFYAQMLVVLVPLAFERLLGERPLLLKAVAALTLLMVSLAVLFTYSRGGMLALAAVAVVLVAVHRPKPMVVAPLAAGVAIALLVMPPAFYERLGTITGAVESVDDGGGGGGGDESVAGRIGEMRVALAMFADHPLLGVGEDNFPTRFLEYSGLLHIENRREERQAHCLYLEIAAENGLPGLLAFGGIMVLAVRSAMRARARFAALGLDGEAGLAGGILVAFVGYGTAAVMLHDAWSSYFWLLVGIAFALPGIVSAEAELHRPRLAGLVAPFRPHGNPGTGWSGRQA